MSEPEINQTIQLPLQPSQAAVVTREGWRVEFNAVGEAPQISHNGLSFTLADGVMVPSAVANDRAIDGAPAVLWHRINGRLTKNDIAQTILLKDRNSQDEPLIYMGTWTPDWVQGREIRTYAAITDACDGNGDRLYQNFNRYVAYLNNHPNGEKLLDRPSDARDVTYEMALAARVMELQPGERTGQMIPTYELLRGQKYPGDDKVTHRNNMYDLRHTGDFAKADNGGNDSRFVTETGSGNAPWYVSSTEYRDRRRAHVCGTVFTGGNDGWGHKASIDWFLRPFVAEFPQP